MEWIKLISSEIIKHKGTNFFKSKKKNLICIEFVCFKSIKIYSIKVYISIVEEFNCYELTMFHIYLGITNDEL